jgi:Glycosyl transferase family 11
MFQYAVAHTLARRHGTEVLVDTSGFLSLKGFKNFELWQFAPLGLTPLCTWSVWRKRLLKEAGFQPPPRPSFTMSTVGYDDSVLLLPDGSHLRGWFQSERYFMEAANDIRRLFDLEPFNSNVAIERLHEVRKIADVVAAIHVRRGDYVGSPLFHVDLIGYYKEAMQLFSKEFNCTYLVFSDDVLWCKKQYWLQGKNIQFAQDLVEFERPICEMALMSRCDHLIIANSTFSWWAAWLCGSMSKRVIIPKRWFVPHDATECGLDVPGWTQL